MQEEGESSAVGAFSCLPTEVILHLYTFLEPKELVLLSSTCKAFYSIGEDTTFWHKFYKDRYSIPKFSMLHYVKRIRFNWKDRFIQRYIEERRISTALEYFRLAMARYNWELNPPLSVEQVEMWERKNLVTLPEDYKRFITEIGDGGDVLWLKRLPPSLPNDTQNFPSPNELETWDQWDIPGSISVGWGRVVLAINGPEKGTVWSYTKRDGPRKVGDYIDHVRAAARQIASQTTDSIGLYELDCILTTGKLPD